jgi:hypothetical protein
LNRNLFSAIFRHCTPIPNRNERANGTNESRIYNLGFFRLIYSVSGISGLSKLYSLSSQFSWSQEQNNPSKDVENLVARDSREDEVSLEPWKYGDSSGRIQKTRYRGT